MTRALKAIAAVAGAAILALLLASVAVVVLAVIAWPLLAALAFGVSHEAARDGLGLTPEPETPPWT